VEHVSNGKCDPQRMHSRSRNRFLSFLFASRVAFRRVEVDSRVRTPLAGLIRGYSRDARFISRFLLTLSFETEMNFVELFGG
jgi:hypothetical protein